MKFAVEVARVSLTATWLSGCGLGAAPGAGPSEPWSVYGMIPMVAVYGVGGLLALAALVPAARDAFRGNALAARAAESARVGSGVPGTAVLAGRVAGGDDAPVRVEVSVEGKDVPFNGRYRSGINCHWNETGRKVAAEPFDLILDSGDTIRVEATEDVVLVEELEIRHCPANSELTLVAELVPGERLTAVGMLEGRAQPDGYRGSAEHHVLVAPSGAGESLLLSTQPLEERFRRGARRALASLAWGAALIVAVQGAAFAYHLSVWTGVVETATFVSCGHGPQSAGPGNKLAVVLADGRQVYRRVAGCPSEATCFVRITPVLGTYGYAWGRLPSLHLGFLVVFLLLPLAVVWLFRRGRVQPWYEGHPVAFVGKGSLAEWTPALPPDL